MVVCSLVNCFCNKGGSLVLCKLMDLALRMALKNDAGSDPAHRQVKPLFEIYV